MLTTKEINKTLLDYPRVVSLMKEAFPKQDQLPLWFLRLMTLRKDVVFTAYYDQHEFVGISYLIFDQEQVYVLYLTTLSQHRSKGYGSDILTTIREKYKGKEIHLNIETPISEAPNYHQRVKRLKFYQKNGFRDTGYRLWDDNDRYSILSTSQSFEKEAFSQLIRKLSLGLYSPQLQTSLPD